MSIYKSFLLTAIIFFAAQSGPANAGCQDPAPARTAHDSIGHAIFDFENAMYSWAKEMWGGLLFYHRIEGPLSLELEAMYRRDPDTQIRLPEQWKWQCMTCNGQGECHATISVRFTGETKMSLRRYKLIRPLNSFWGLHSEVQMEDTTKIRKQLKACWQALEKRRTERPDTWWTE